MIFALSPPTKPGFYWIRSVKPGVIEQTIAMVSSTQYDNERGFRVECLGHMDCYWMTNFTEPNWLMEWAGPLNNPTPGNDE